jgi:hypothetical protein
MRQTSPRADGRSPRPASHTTVRPRLPVIETQCTTVCWPSIPPLHSRAKFLPARPHRRCSQPHTVSTFRFRRLHPHYCTFVAARLRRVDPMRQTHDTAKSRAAHHPILGSASPSPHSPSQLYRCKLLLTPSNVYPGFIFRPPAIALRDAHCHTSNALQTASLLCLRADRPRLPRVCAASQTRTPCVAHRHQHMRCVKLGHMLWHASTVSNRLSCGNVSSARTIALRLELVASHIQIGAVLSPSTPLQRVSVQSFAQAVKHQHKRLWPQQVSFSAIHCVMRP